MVAENSRDRNKQVFYNYDHLRPKYILPGDCDTKLCKKFIRDFSGWITSSFPAGCDKGFIWKSLNSMIDGDWQTRLESVEGIQEMEMDALWQVLDEKLLLSFPLFSRRIEYLRLTQNRDELTSTFWTGPYEIRPVLEN